MAETSSIRHLKTAAICCSYFSIGMVSSIIGPTILELQCAVGVDYEDVLKILPARSSGFAMGSFIVGVLHKYLNPLITVTINLTVMGLCTTMIPWTNSLVSLMIVVCCNSIACGVVDNSFNVLMLYMWGKESQPYMQALHFSFGLGGLVAPLLASRFLSSELPIEGFQGNATSETLGKCNPTDLEIHIPYSILGAISLCMALVFLYLTCFYGQTDEHPSRLAKKDGSADVSDFAWAKRLVVCLAALFMFTVVGLELGLAAFITSFAVMSDHHLSKQAGAYMTSLYWFTYTFFRLSAIAFTKRISVHQNITISLSILALANVFLVPFGNSVEWCLWVGVALVGIGISTVWASTYSLLESHFPVTSGAASFLTCVACLGAWVYPVIMGYAIETSPQLYLWTICACSALCCLVFVVLCIVLKTTKTSSKKLAAEKSQISPPGDTTSMTVISGLICVDSAEKQNDL